MTKKTSAKPKPLRPDPHPSHAPSKLKRILVRQGMTYEQAAKSIRAVAKKSLRLRVKVAGPYLARVANGWTPSLPLGRAIVRWALDYGEPLDLRDLGVEVG